MGYLAYLQFLPLFVKLIGFIRQAEATYKGQGTGTQKLAAVFDEFTGVIQAGVSAKLIPQKLADEFIAGAPALISVIVQIFNAVHGSVPAPVQP